MRKRMNSTLSLVVTCLAAAWGATAFAHGGGGRSYTATGPITRRDAPALQYFGGFDGRGLTFSHGFQMAAATGCGACRGPAITPHRFVGLRHARAQ